MKLSKETRYVNIPAASIHNSGPFWVAASRFEEFARQQAVVAVEPLSL
jgi:hypothetical protein